MLSTIFLDLDELEMTSFEIWVIKRAISIILWALVFSHIFRSTDTCG